MTASFGAKISISPFIPSFPEHIKPSVRVEEYAKMKVDEAKLFDEILGYLANEDKVVHPGRIRLVDNPNSSVLGLAKHCLYNAKQIFLDCFACGVCPCTDPAPVAPTYLTKREYESLNSARMTYNRVTGVLCCCGPAVAVAVPCITTVPASAVMGLAIINNVSALMMTGCMTFFWSDFSAKESAAYESLKTGFTKTAEHLELKWRLADTVQGQEISDQCDKIADNFERMIQGMTNRGISIAHAQDILEPLSSVLKKIRFSTFTASTEDLPPLLASEPIAMAKSTLIIPV